MRKHVMAMTYEPKKEAVFDGRCTQTIRKGNKVSIGDEILFHDWEGLPYRSKWLQRKRITVTDVIPIQVFDTYFTRDGNPMSPTWKGKWGGILAEMDYIDPPTGEALRDVLFGLNGVPERAEQFQIIRW